MSWYQKALIIGWLWLSAAGPMAATDFFVAPGGNDGGPGTQELPFATVSRGLQAATQPGDRVWLRAGTYQPTAGLNMVFAGLPGKPIQLAGYPGELVIIDGSATPPGTDLLWVGRAWTVVQNLTLRSSSRIGLSVWGPGSIVHDVVIRDNEIYDSVSHGIFVGYQNRIDPIRDILVQGNRIHHNGRVNEAPPHTAWPIASGAGPSTGVSYVDNDIYKNWGEGLGFFLADHCLARGNRIADNFSVNLYLDNATDCRLEGNFVYSTGDKDFFRQGFQASGIQIANEFYSISNPSTRNEIVNNVLFENRWTVRYGSYQLGGGLRETLIAHNTAFAAAGTLFTIDDDAGHTGSRVINNIFVQTEGRPLTSVDETFPGAEFSYNLWWGGAPSPAATGPGDLVADPEFVAPGALVAGAYAPRTTSPVYGSGTELPETPLDFYGSVRPSPPSLGAIESSPLFGDGFESGDVIAWRRMAARRPLSSSPGR